MRKPEILAKEEAFVEKELGDRQICSTCHATLGTYADDCTAYLSHPCFGFMAIEEARRKFKEQSK